MNETDSSLSVIDFREIYSNLRLIDKNLIFSSNVLNKIDSKINPLKHVSSLIGDSPIKSEIAYSMEKMALPLLNLYIDSMDSLSDNTMGKEVFKESVNKAYSSIQSELKNMKMKSSNRFLKNVYKDFCSYIDSVHDLVMDIDSLITNYKGVTEDIKNFFNQKESINQEFAASGLESKLIGKNEDEAFKIIDNYLHPNLVKKSSGFFSKNGKYLAIAGLFGLIAGSQAINIVKACESSKPYYAVYDHDLNDDGIEEVWVVYKTSCDENAHTCESCNIPEYTVYGVDTDNDPSTFEKFIVEHYYHVPGGMSTENINVNIIKEGNRYILYFPDEGYAIDNVKDPWLSQNERFFMESVLLMDHHNTHPDMQSCNNSTYCNVFDATSIFQVVQNFAFKEGEMSVFRLKGIDYDTLTSNNISQTSESQTHNINNSSHENDSSDYSGLGLFLGSFAGLLITPRIYSKIRPFLYNNSGHKKINHVNVAKKTIVNKKLSTNEKSLESIPYYDIITSKEIHEKYEPNDLDFKVVGDRIKIFKKNNFEELVKEYRFSNNKSKKFHIHELGGEVIIPGVTTHLENLLMNEFKKEKNTVHFIYE